MDAGGQPSHDQYQSPCNVHLHSTTLRTGTMKVDYHQKDCSSEQGWTHTIIIIISISEVFKGLPEMMIDGCMCTN